MPIVAADAAALPEIVRDGENGFLVSSDDPTAFADRMQQLVESPLMAAEFSRSSAEIGIRHSNEQTFSSYESLYERIAGESRVAL